MFRTKDLNLAAYFVTEGAELTSLDDAEDGRSRWFVFAEIEERDAEAWQRNYLNGGEVAACDYADNIRRMKNLVMRNGRS